MKCSVSPVAKIQRLWRTVAPSQVSLMGLCLRRKEVRERRHHVADPVGVCLELFERRVLAGAGNIDRLHLFVDAIHQQLACQDHFVGPIDPGQTRLAVLAR